METDCKKRIFIQIVSLLYIILFVYAAISKLLDFENFQAQLGQSPIVSNYTGVVSFAVPAIELTLSILLSFPKLKLFGLYGSFALMVMFTAYIHVILNYASNIPCSCGGILEEMGWKEHFIFNCFFVAIAAGAIL
ncbi:MauE/DoxX family redox-associated membrane protein, partial [uncultured Flavobacterium sp.]|uniref:MauE/DoxX family redox-associated membrane protein n=1 Tax=uncultured Flavobacterium sp. TaxID=165435 RepID=UPI00345351CE